MVYPLRVPEMDFIAFLKRTFKIDKAIEVSCDGMIIEKDSHFQSLLSFHSRRLFTMYLKDFGKTAIFWDYASVHMSHRHSVRKNLMGIASLVDDAVFYVVYDSTNPSHSRASELEGMSRVFTIDQSSYKSKYNPSIGRIIHDVLFDGESPPHVLIMSGDCLFFNYVRSICSEAKWFYLLYPKRMATTIENCEKWSWTKTVEEVFSSIPSDFKTSKLKLKMIDSDLRPTAKEFIPSPRAEESKSPSPLPSLENSVVSRPTTVVWDNTRHLMSKMRDQMKK